MNRIPSILELAAVPSNARVIGLPDGRRVLVSTYVHSWRKLKTLPPQEPVEGWSWFAETASQVLADIWRGVEDRINIRGGLRLEYRDNSARIEARRRQRVKCECRWCGQPLPEYKPLHSRFCEASCYRSFNGY